jgi:hypothetical protein
MRATMAHTYTIGLGRDLSVSLLVRAYTAKFHLPGCKTVRMFDRRLKIDNPHMHMSAVCRQGDDYEDLLNRVHSDRDGVRSESL